jgi:hypothetical protein
LYAAVLMCNFGAVDDICNSWVVFSMGALNANEIGAKPGRAGGLGSGSVLAQPLQTDSLPGAVQGMEYVHRAFYFASKAAHYLGPEVGING